MNNNNDDITTKIAEEVANGMDIVDAIAQFGSDDLFDKLAKTVVTANTNTALQLYLTDKKTALIESLSAFERDVSAVFNDMKNTEKVKVDVIFTFDSDTPKSVAKVKITKVKSPLVFDSSGEDVSPDEFKDFGRNKRNK